MDYSREETAGLEQNLGLLVQKLNLIKESLIVETDPSVKFKLKQDLEKTEEERRALENQLADRYGLDSSEGRSAIEEKIRALDIEEEIGPIYLVNCDRKEEVEKFWTAYDERKREHFQFYFVSACPTQMPPSFCERMIFELILEELDDRDEAVLCFRKPDSQRVSILDLPLGRNLESSQKKFRVNFSERFQLREGLSFEDFIRSGIPRLKYEYVALVFYLNESKWKDFVPQYFEWLITTFSDTHENVPTFLFFFAIYIEGLHETPGHGQAILEPIQRLVGKHHSTVLLTPLNPVSKKDLKGWFMSLGERNPGKVEEVIETMVKGLKGKDLNQFQQRELLNMDDIERLQELVYRVASRRV